MAWSNPRTWTVGELVTAAYLNQEMRDNIAFLAAPNMDGDTLNLGADITIASTTFVSIDATNYKASIVVPQGFTRVRLDLLLCWAHSTLGNILSFDWLNSQTGARVGGDDGIGSQSVVVANAKMITQMTYIVEGLTGGLTYTFTPQMKNTANTTTIYAGAGTASADVHTQCYARLT